MRCLHCTASMSSEPGLRHMGSTTVGQRCATNSVAWQRATTSMTTVGGSRIEVRCDIRPDPAATVIGKAAGTPYAPERRIRRQAALTITVRSLRAIPHTIECCAITGLPVWRNRVYQHLTRSCLSKMLNLGQGDGQGRSRCVHESRLAARCPPSGRQR